MTPQQLHLLAVVAIAVCWGAFALTWLVGAIYYQSRAPAERSRSWLGSTTWIGLAIIAIADFAVPRADWRSVVVHTPWVRILGLVILLAATALTLWARLTLSTMWSAAPAVREQHQLRTSGP